MKICPVCSREFAAEQSHCLDDGVALVGLSATERGRPEELIGKVVEGRYRVERIVGKGGMGTVYAARHVVVGKAVALKVLRAGADQDEGVLQRFIREAQTTNLLKSRHIVEINDFGQLPSGLFFVVMELLEGMDLTRAMKPGVLTRAQLIHVFIQIAEALGGAHNQGIVHRDLKPDNVFLVNEGGDPLFVKLLDFGIAKLLHGDARAGLTETGVILGTPYYMSPEQARADHVDHRTDIYALGVMMYRAFTGKLPFVADSTMGVLTRHLSEMPEPPSKVSQVQPRAEVLILRCLEKKPEQRPQSMREVASDLRGMLVEEERRGGRVVREDPTVNALGQGSPIAPMAPMAPMAPIAAPTFTPTFTPQAGIDPRAASGQHPSGGFPAAHASGQHPSGGFPAAHASGQHPSGGFASAVTPPGTAYPSGNYPAAGSRLPLGGGVPQQAETSVTSLHWPGGPGSTGSPSSAPGSGGSPAGGPGFTTRSLATSSVPAPAASSSLGPVAIAALAAVMVAAGAIAAVVFFGLRPRAPATALPAETSAAPSASIAAAPASASAAAIAGSAPSAAPPPGSAEPVAQGATVSPVRAPVRPRGGVAPSPPPTAAATAAPTAKPSASAPPRRTTSDIRSPFD